jgi:hypothetical protein
MKSLSCFLSLAFSLLSTQVSHATPVFDKTPNQFCPDTMTALQQVKIYSRIANIGASFGHGCTTCETKLDQREYMRTSGDLGWSRRNFLMQFIQNTQWKDKYSFRHDFIAITENDSRSEFTNIFPLRDLERKPYRSRWIYRKGLDVVEELPLELETQILSDTSFKDESDLVGGANIRTKRKAIKNRRKTGILYQTYPGSYSDTGATKKTIIDLSVDQTKSYELFNTISDPEIYKKLSGKGWDKADLREKLISQATERILSTRPSLIFLVDTFFWDTVPYLFSYVKKKKPDSLLFKLVTSRLFTRYIDLKLKSPEEEENKLNDLFEVFKRVSNGNKTSGPTPIILARLIDNPGKAMVKTGEQEAFGALIGAYLNTLTGIDITEEITFWLKQIQYEEKSDTYKTSVAYKQNILTLQNSINDGDKGIVKKLLVAALVDLPLIIKAADYSFNLINKKIRSFSSRKDNNVHMVNADPFYLNFHNIIHPLTMHPTVDGAKFMSDMVRRSTCVNK